MKLQDVVFSAGLKILPIYLLLTHFSIAKAETIFKSNSLFKSAKAFPKKTE